jgi:cell division protein FtsB
MARLSIPVARSTASRARERLRLAVLALLGAVALWFAIEGGEYGTIDLLRQQNQKRHLTRDIDSLARVVDSLARYRNSVLVDPRVQERIAREKFGMVRGNELLYRFAEPDSGK